MDAGDFTQLQRVGVAKRANDFPAAVHEFVSCQDLTVVKGGLLWCAPEPLHFELAAF